MAVDILDVSKSDGYSMLSLTQLMQKVPYNPQRMTSLFSFEGISTATAMIEIRDGVISILGTSPRGSNTPTHSQAENNYRLTWSVPHIETADAVMADALLGVRTLGGSEQEAIDSVMARKMGSMKLNIGATWEFHAAAAIITGVVLDADGTTLLDINSKFGVTRPNVDFLLTTTTTDVRAKCVAAGRACRDALKGVPHTGLVGFCGRNFWDALTGHATVTESFKYQEAQMNRANLDMQSFMYGGIAWELYDTYVGSTAYLHTDKAVVVPTGVPDNYQCICAPSDRLTGGVGTIGVPIYTWQKPMDDDKGLKLTSQTNPSFIVRRSDAIVTCDKIS